MIGIMSDSHDNREAIKLAVRKFNELGCRLVLHAGDFVAPFAAGELQNLSCPVKAVFGNCDGEKKGLEKTVGTFGIIKKAPFCFRQNGLEFLLTHTHFSLPVYVNSHKYDVIIFGHTHKPEIKTAKGVLLINPGETGGWVSGKCTIALLNTKTVKAEIIELT